MKLALQGTTFDLQHGVPEGALLGSVVSSGHKPPLHPHGTMHSLVQFICCRLRVLVCPAAASVCAIPAGLRKTGLTTVRDVRNRLKAPLKHTSAKILLSVTANELSSHVSSANQIL